MKPTYSYFTGSSIFCLIALVIAFVFGGMKAAMTVLFLTVLETSLSFDNAVVNAGILKDWSEVWRRRFLTWGIIIAVFGMRLVFPLVIVGIAGGIGPLNTIALAMYSPAEYSRILSSAHHQIAAFGATFLMMVFFSFFVARHKTEHWLSVIEKPLTRLGKMEAIEAALTLAALLGASRLLQAPLRGEFIEAGIWGIVTYILSKGLAALLGGDDDGVVKHHVIVRQGICGFLYLELIDSSFSFDGVIGAFALTNNLFFIMLGLGAGAMFVRSFTLLLVHNRTLIRYRYLEHGAFWAIGALAGLMMIGAGLDVPEAITGVMGAVMIGASLGSSILENRRQVTTQP
ncbi:MAG: Integral rane protein TerC family protein [Burkholderiaceae bacterium]|nr:Integral rane protein TerC family protein [Burkholderiaceae bacterium]